MTAGTTLAVNRRAPAPTREELRRQLLALVLALVLVWYTFVVPANAAGSYTRNPADDDAPDGEVRGVGGAARAENVKGEKGGAESAEDLDWPEYIYP